MGSYSLLLVDDESFVVDWLYELLEGGLADELTLYKAYTPQRALEIAGNTRIDLLITDINMPGQTGLAIVEEVTRVWPLCKSILLTGHPDFEYAQRAIHLGVVSYILKTSTDAQILADVTAALRAIDESLRQHHRLIDLQQNLDEHISQLKRQVFFTWIRGNFQSAEELGRCRELLGFDESAKPYYLMIAATSVSPIPHGQSLLSESISVFRLKSIANHYISQYLQHLAVEVANTRIIWILQPAHGFPQCEQFERILMGALELVQNAAADTLGMEVSFLISEALDSATEIPEHYLLLKNQVEMVPSGEALIRLSEKGDATALAGQAQVLHRQSIAQKLRRHLDEGGEAAFSQLLDEISAEILGTLNWHSSRTLENYFTLLNMLLGYINENELENLPGVKPAIHSLSHPWRHASFEDTREEMQRLAALLFDERAARKSSNAHSVLDQVRAYIDGHIDREIFLLDLSEMTGYSTNYLSRFFSKATGTTISEYIAQKKLERIHSLMQDSTLTITDIARMTGFQSRTYFNSYFKRHTGLAPGQYRESLTGEKEKG